VKALALINLCAREYNDTSFARVAKAPSGNTANWLDWLNDAQRAVVLARPDAAGVTQNITLVDGTKQALPAGSVKLLGVVRNRGVAGTQAGRTIVLIDRDTKDASSKTWHSKTASVTIDEVIYDDRRSPLTFYTDPPATAGTQIEVELAKSPTDVTDADAGDISLPDTYAPAMEAWMLFRAYAMNTQSTGQLQRAGGYFTQFFNLLGVKARGEMWDSAYARGQLPLPQSVK
jgi:hypothetical protein